VNFLYDCYMLKATLCQIGFTNNEAKIYLALINLGSQPANIIAKKAGLKRTTVYPLLDNLQKKSLISSFIKNGIKFFAVNDINNILEYLERKKRLIDHQKDFVLDILPRMEQLRAGSLSPPRVHYFEGADGVETVMNDSLKARGPILSIASVEKWNNSDLNDFIKIYGKFIIEKHIPMKILSKDTEDARCFFENSCKDTSHLLEMRYVKGGDDLFDNIVNIYDNRVAIVSPEKGFEFGVLIDSEEFARTQRNIFELAWKGVLIHNNEV